MADVDVSGVTESVAVAEVLARMLDVNAVASQAIGALAEVLTVGAPNTQMWRGANTATVGCLTVDYQLITHYPKFSQAGFPLKGIILIPGSGAPDTFVIKDVKDTGPYLYKAALSAATVLVYPGTLCFPYIDFSECTLTAGHLITFVW